MSQNMDDSSGCWLALEKGALYPDRQKNYNVMKTCFRETLHFVCSEPQNSVFDTNSSTECLLTFTLFFVCSLLSLNQWQTLKKKKKKYANLLLASVISACRRWFPREDSFKSAAKSLLNMSGMKNLYLFMLSISDPAEILAERYIWVDLRFVRLKCQVCVKYKAVMQKEI